MDPARARELLAREHTRIAREHARIARELAALEQEIAALERAQARLAAGTYGRSVVSGEPIPDARLEALPTAERTVDEEDRAP